MRRETDDLPMGHRWQVKDITEESIRQAAQPLNVGSLERLMAMYPDCPPKVVLRAVQKSKIVNWGVSENHYWIDGGDDRGE